MFLDARQKATVARCLDAVGTRSASGYSRVLTGTHGYSRVLTGTLSTCKRYSKERSASPPPHTHADTLVSSTSQGRRSWHVPSEGHSRGTHRYPLGVLHGVLSGYPQGTPVGRGVQRRRTGRGRPSCAARTSASRTRGATWGYPTWREYSALHLRRAVPKDPKRIDRYRNRDFRFQ
jgi:hypothetical protein